MPFPAFDEQTGLCGSAALQWWRAGQEMSGHHNPAIARSVRGFREDGAQKHPSVKIQTNELTKVLI